MNTQIQFQSDFYEPIQWEKIITNALRAINLNFEDNSVETCQDQLKNPMYLYQLQNKINQQFILNVLKDAYECIRKIFIYTYDHLKSRQFNELSLTENLVIKNQLSEVYISFSVIKNLFDQRDFELSYILESEIQLADLLLKLSGARGILKNNIGELKFNLKLFQRLFLC